MRSWNPSTPRCFTYTREISRSIPNVILRALAESLGCALDEGPLGPFFRTDETKETTVRGVFACGDVARGMGSVAFAVGDGARAGMAAHQSLLFRPGE